MGLFDAFAKLKPVLAPFEFVGKKIGVVVNTILLTVVYFTAFAITALIAKTFRKKFLELKPDKSIKSYWMNRKNDDYSKKESYRSF